MIQLNLYMYETYFNLNENPFRITPDPRFLWYSESHQEAKQKLYYHLTYSAGPIYLLADIGTGKTTLAKRLVEELQTNKHNNVVYVFAPKLRTANAFLRFIMDNLDVKTERSFAGSLQNFQEYLLEQFEQKTSPILLIDEAQNMSRDMLHLIQHLFNFSTHQTFLIQIAIFAQPEFQGKLDRLPSLKSRMNISKLEPFTLEQTAEMLSFRWTVAGGKDLPFTPEAIEIIHELTQGIPRLIVKICNEALMKTAVDNQQQVTPETVRHVSTEIAGVI